MSDDLDLAFERENKHHDFMKNVNSTLVTEGNNARFGTNRSIFNKPVGFIKDVGGIVYRKHENNHFRRLKRGEIGTFIKQENLKEENEINIEVSKLF